MSAKVRRVVVSYRHDPARAWITALLVALGGITLGMGAAVKAPLPLRLAVPVALVVAAAAVVRPAVEVTRRPVSVRNHWNNGRVYECLRNAAPTAHVRILQTWIPEREQLFQRLEDLIVHHDKRFTIEVMLLHPGEPDGTAAELLGARLRHRFETLDEGRSHIVGTAAGLLALKDKVNQALKEKGAHINMSVKCYRFLPFGPVYEIGGHIFVGFYLSSRGSVNAPVLEIRRGSGPMWQAFHSVFGEPWDGADEVVAVQEGRLVFATPAAVTRRGQSSPRSADAAR
jgi:hypothetical protein